MIRRTTDWLSMHYGVEVVTVKLKFPVRSDEDLLAPFREALRRHGSEIKVGRRAPLDCFRCVCDVPCCVCLTCVKDRVDTAVLKCVCLREKTDMSLVLTSA